MTQHETKHRILDAAEDLFAKEGYSATSVRAITLEAKVNVAAIHYHFGTKQALLEALFERRVRDVNDERLERLDEAQARPGQPPELDELLHIFLEPPLRRLGSGDAGWERFTRVMGRILGESGDHVVGIQKVFLQIRERFSAAMQQALPHLSPEEIAWRMHFLLGAMSFLLANPGRLALMTEGRCNAENSEETLAQLTAFVRGGFAAPSARTLTRSDSEDAR